MMKCERGSSQEFVDNILEIYITTLSWNDNKIVNFISTYVGAKPFSDQINDAGTIKRFDTKDKTIKMIPCPPQVQQS